MDAIPTGDGSPVAIGFIGDLDDPWIVAIAEALATDRRVDRLDCAGPLPDRPFGDAPPRAIVVHRHRLDATDAERLRRWRGQDGGPELILCNSPYLRYEELERACSLVDLVVSEAIAGEVLPGRLARRLDGHARTGPPPRRLPCRIEAAGGNDELARALAESCTRAGYVAGVVDDREIGGPTRGEPRRPPGERVLTIWEVPLLEPGWVHRLECRASRTGPVIALGGFADRSVVTQAWGAGAVACLELPCDLEDLIDVIDRTVGRMPPESWPVPIRIEPPHRLPPPRRNPRRHRLLVAPPRWPDGEASPTILPRE